MTVNMTENVENDDAGDRGVGGRHCGVSVVVDGVLDHGWCHTMIISQ